MTADSALPDGCAAAEVLVLAPIGRDAAVTCSLLAQVGIVGRALATIDELCTSMEQEAGVAVVAEEALDAAGLQRLERVLADQPSWSEPPLILLASRHRSPGRLRPLIQRRSTALLRRPLHVATFLSVVRSALENRRRQLEVRDLLIDLRRSNQHLAERARQLQGLALQLTEAEEAERRRLAMLLHDNLQQLLAAAGFRLMAMEGADAGGGRVGEQIGSLRALLGEAGELARNLSRELDPPGLRRGGLAPALQWLAEQMQEHHGLAVEVDAPRDAEPEEERVNRLLFRAARELLFNVVKHARCEAARLALRREDRHAVLTVADDGCGFEVETLRASPGGGLGVLSIRERADLLGGGLVVDSRAGEGTRIELRVPLDPSGSSATVTPPEPPPGLPEEPAPPRMVAHHRAGGVRVLLVDDHAVMRQGLRALLAGEVGIEVVGEASNGAEAVAAAQRLRPDVVVMDASMPVMDGPEATRRIRSVHPSARIIGLSMFDDSEMGETMRAAGAERYLCKSGPGDDLVAAVRGQAPTGRRPA